MRLLLTLVLVSLTQLMSSQDCGSVAAVPPTWQMSDLAEYMSPSRAPIDSVGVAVHLLTDDLSPVTQEEIQLELDVVNQNFAAVGIHFFICSIGEVYSRSSFTTEDIAEVNKQMHIPNRINLYIPPRLTTVGTFKICGQAMFPWENEPDERYIVVSRRCLDNGTTMVHEFGHFYGLLHTHERSFGVELVDGSNCQSAGDQLCDTPADPQFGPGHMRDCTFIGAQRDANGDLYVPDPTLIMSYAPKECRSRFTGQQYALMRYYAQAEHQRYVSSCDFLPDIFIDVQELPDTVRFSDEISFFVHVVSNIVSDTVFDLTIDISSDRLFFNRQIYRETIVANDAGRNQLREITVAIPSDLPEGRLFMRVYADSDQLLTEGNEYNNFVTKEIHLNHSSFEEAALFPNPATDVLHYFFRAEQIPRDYVIRIFNASGQLVENYNMTSDSKEIYANLDLANLSAGVYVLRLYLLTEGKTVSSRFVVAR